MLMICLAIDIKKAVNLILFRRRFGKTITTNKKAHGSVSVPLFFS